MSAMKQHMHPTSAIDPALTPGRLLNVNQVADVLGCGRTLVYDLLSRGDLNRVKIGRLTRVPFSELDRYVRRQMGVEDSGPAARSERRRSRHHAAPTLPF